MARHSCVCEDEAGLCAACYDDRQQTKERFLPMDDTTTPSAPIDTCGAPLPTEPEPPAHFIDGQFVYHCEGCGMQYKYRINCPDIVATPCGACGGAPILKGPAPAPAVPVRTRKVRSDKGTKRAPKAPAPALNVTAGPVCAECPAGLTVPCGGEPGGPLCDRKIVEALSSTEAPKTVSEARLPGGSHLVAKVTHMSGTVEEIECVAVTVERRW